MKKNLVIATVVGSLMLGSVSHANAMDKNLEEKLIKVCVALKSDSRIKLQQAISDVPAGYKQIAEGLLCNGMDPINFALHNGADKTAKLLAARSNKDYDEMLAKL